MKACRKYILYNGIKLREKNEKERNSMKLGFVSAILDTWSYEEMMDFASEHGFECVEVACCPQGKAERRYAGVSHIDVDKVLADDEYAKHILDYSKEKNVEISSLAF